MRWREQDEIGLRGGSREGEILGRGGNGQREEGIKGRDGDNLTIHRRTASFCSERQVHGRENHRAIEEREEGRERKTIAAGLIDGTIWKRRGAGSLMSLRIDEDKMGLGSRGNNLWGFMLLLMGRVLAWPASDGRSFPLSSIRLHLRSAAETRKGRSITKGRNGWVRVSWKSNQQHHFEHPPSPICLHNLSFNMFLLWNLL